MSMNAVTGVASTKFSVKVGAPDEGVPVTMVDVQEIDLEIVDEGTASKEEGKAIADQVSLGFVEEGTAFALIKQPAQPAKSDQHERSAKLPLWSLSGAPQVHGQTQLA